jgi:hypothetical protein
VLDFVNALDAAFQVIQKNVYPHAPFYGVMLVLLIIGDRMSSRIFTKERAYRAYPGTYGRWKWRVYFWGRETLPMQPILMGALIGLAWLDPEGKSWNRAASMAYFATAGAASMILWAFTKAWAKKKGIVLALPGESGPPTGKPSMPYELEVVNTQERAPWDEQHVKPSTPIPPADDFDTRVTDPPRGDDREDTRNIRIQPLRAPTITRIEKKRDP